MSPLVFGLPQGSEIVILIIVALLIFGGSRIAGLGKSAGRAIREFKEETRAIKADEERAKASGQQKSEESGATASDRVVDAEIVENRTDPKPDNPA